MKLLESLLTRVTMYTLTGSILVVILASALVLSLFEVMPFAPAALVASTAVFVGVSVGANYGLGKLYGIKTHIRSAGITGLLLAALFTPTLESTILLQYAFIAVLAMASKYILTYKGRHIFNPAAVGAFLAGILSIQYASWWIATPSLFVIIALGAFAVLYKVRDLAMAGTFVLLGIILVVISGVMSGGEARELLQLALVSWPIIFLAGFMLSEPLTLPPRRWQKIVVAAAIASIVGLPFQIGTFHTSPEFALIVGNIVAFIFAFKQRKNLQLRLTKRRKLTPSSEEYVFTANTPVVFEPGQYIELSLPHKKEDIRGSRRSFSITSTPGSKTVSVGIKFYDPSSSFKLALRALPLGSHFQSTGITGDFILPKDRSEKLLFIAGGIGITPFISHVLSIAKENRDVTLLYFMRTPEEAAYKDILDASNVDVHYFVADNENELFSKATQLTERLLQDRVTRLRERHAYISGPPVMVAAAKKLVKGRVARIHTDYFSGY